MVIEEGIGETYREEEPIYVLILEYQAPIM